MQTSFLAGSRGGSRPMSVPLRRTDPMGCLENYPLRLAKPLPSTVSSDATFPLITLGYYLNTNKVLASVELRRQSLGMQKARREPRDTFDHAKPAAPSEAGSTGEGASGLLNPDDLSEFDGAGGWQPRRGQGRLGGDSSK